MSGGCYACRVMREDLFHLLAGLAGEESEPHSMPPRRKVRANGGRRRSEFSEREKQLMRAGFAQYVARLLQEFSETGNVAAARTRITRAFDEFEAMCP